MTNTDDDHRSVAGWTIFTLILGTVAALWIWIHIDFSFVAAWFPHENASRTKNLNKIVAPPRPSRKPSPSSTATDFTPWLDQGLTVLSDDAKAPDGTQSATRIIEDSNDETHRLSASLDIDIAHPVTAELYAHAGKDRRLLIDVTSGDDGFDCDVDLTTGKASMRMRGQAIDASCGTTAGKEQWWIVTLSGKLKKPGHTTVAVSPTIRAFDPVFQGDGTSNILVWTLTIR